jgi:hypothetical protein
MYWEELPIFCSNAFLEGEEARNQGNTIEMNPFSGFNGRCCSVRNIFKKYRFSSSVGPPRDNVK